MKLFNKTTAAVLMAVLAAGVEAKTSGECGPLSNTASTRMLKWGNCTMEVIVTVEGQVATLEGQVSTLEGQVAKLETVKADIKYIDDKLARKADKIYVDDKLAQKANKTDLAATAALSGLFQPYNVGKVNITAALGGYDSYSALAVGAGYRANENFAVKAGVATGFQRGAEGKRGVMYNIGANYEF